MQYVHIITQIAGIILVTTAPSVRCWSVSNHCISGYLQSEAYFLKFIILTKDAHRLLEVSSYRKTVTGYSRASLTTERICSRTQVIYPGFLPPTQQKWHPGATATILQARPDISTVPLLAAQSSVHSEISTSQTVFNYKAACKAWSLKLLLLFNMIIYSSL